MECTNSSGDPLESVTYSIIGGDSDPFQLNEITGQLSWRQGQVLDYENTTSYVFSILCVDNFDPNDTAVSVVNVSVIPVNEYVPTITSGNLMIALVVREDTPVGTVLLSTEPGGAREVYTIEDLDDGPDGQLTFTFSSQSSPILSRLFQLDMNTGALSIAQNLVDSAPLIISGVIIVCDANRPGPECPSLNVTLNITADIRERVNVALLESTEVGAQVTEVTCPESDSIQGGIVIQSITPSMYADSFELNSTERGSRVVTLREPLDYEAPQPQQAINITLRCFNSQSTPNEVFFDVIINILPVNDIAPQFNQAEYDFTVDIATGAEKVCCVLATDGDRDIGGNVSYSLFDAQGRFSIQNNGEITFVLSTLTDKVGTTFVVEVTASDGEFRSTVRAKLSVIESPSSFGITEIIIIAVCGAAAILIVIILIICCCCIRHYTA